MLYEISGCSGGGKTTLMNALASRGFCKSDEPGREIVRGELDTGGSAVPWKNPVAFSGKCAELSIRRLIAATQAGNVCFFDRSLVDSVSALIFEKPDQSETYLHWLDQYRYANTVFMAPPWPEIFENDPERRHCFKEAVAEYDRLVATYTLAGYSNLVLPKSTLTERIDFVLEHIK